MTAGLAAARRATTRIAADRRRAQRDCDASDDPAIIAALSELVGRVLAEKYRLDALLGRGGMGLVLSGEHLATGRPIAVKVLRPEMSSDATLGKRFVREVKAAAGLVHPNVVSVLDFGVEPDGTAYQVLELLEGETLAERLDRGRLTPARALELLLPILHALEVAHARGIVHRDLKPDNVFLSRNARGRIVPKLLDFGIAKVLAPETPRDRSETHTTQLGTVIGTPAYMSPEQARGAEVGPPTDIWAIAVVLFECLSGRVPFEDENASIMMARVMLERAPSLASVAPDVPPSLARAVDAALMQEPSARPPTMAALERLLRAGAAEAKIPLPAPGLSDCEDDEDVAGSRSSAARALAPTQTPAPSPGTVEPGAEPATVSTGSARRRGDGGPAPSEPEEDRTGPLGPLRPPRATEERSSTPSEAERPSPTRSSTASVRPAATPVPHEGARPAWWLGVAAAVALLVLAAGAYAWQARSSGASAGAASGPPAVDERTEPAAPVALDPVGTAPVPSVAVEPVEVATPEPTPSPPGPEVATPTSTRTRSDAHRSRERTEASEPRAEPTPPPGRDGEGEPAREAGSGELPGIREW